MNQQYEERLQRALDEESDSGKCAGGPQADAANGTSAAAVYRERGPGGLLPETWSDSKVARMVARAVAGDGSSVLATAFEDSYPTLPLAVIVQIGPYRYAPFMFSQLQPWRTPLMVPNGCLHERHTTFGPSTGAIIRLGDGCYETDRGVGVRFCPACVRTLARACIPPQSHPDSHLDGSHLSLRDALYTVGAVLDPVWEAGVASFCHHRGPASQERIRVPWETHVATIPSVDALPAPEDVSTWPPDMRSLFRCFEEHHLCRGREPRASGRGRDVRWRRRTLSPRRTSRARP